MTPAELAAIRELEAKATKGPWVSHSCPDMWDAGAASCRVMGQTRNVFIHHAAWNVSIEDMEFITVARTAVPALLAEIDRQCDRIVELQGEVERLKIAMSTIG